MTSPQLYRKFAAYNRWMNEKIYSVCAEIPDAERKADRRAYFRSIHSTLNHLLYGDHAWLNRLAGASLPMAPSGTDLHDDFDGLRARRIETDAALVSWTDGLTTEWLARETEWASAGDGIKRVQPHWLLVSHLFNHQTHHRGQVTTLLAQLGHDVGITDLPRM